MNESIRSAGLGLMLAACALLAACAEPEEEATAEDVQREARELSETLESYAAERRDEALERSREMLAAIEERQEQLEERFQARWEEMDSAARDEADEQLETLESRRDAVTRWYERMENSSADAWTEVRDGFEEAVAAFRETWREAEQEIESADRE